MCGQPKRLMVLGCGSCGQVFPGVGVAHLFIAQGWQVRWLCTAD
ncbi:glycosyltransferase, partial [Salmonella enterica subsp. enterica serovar Infantis]